MEEVRAHEMALIKGFLEGARQIPGLKSYGPADIEQRFGVVSFNLADLMPSEVGLMLEMNWGILCRVGLHCAPAAHRTIGTYPTGTVRFSWSIFNSMEQIEAALGALAGISERQRTGGVLTLG